MMQMMEELSARQEKTRKQDGQSKEPELIDRNELASAPLTEEQEIYKENILDHYKHPRNNSIPEHPHIVRHGHNPLCGDEMTIYGVVKTSTKAEEWSLSFTGHGCAISQAAASLLTEELQRKSSAEIKSWDEEKMMALLGIPISPVRRKCALLALKTVQQGVAVWHLK